MTAREDRPPDRPTVAAFAGMTLLAGANAVGVRVTLAELPPFWGGGLRFLMAGLVLTVLVGLLRRRLPQGDRLIGTVLFGLLAFALPYVLLYWALQDAPAGTTQVILAVVPLLTLLLAVGHGVERFRRMGLVGALIAAAGIAVIFGDQASLAVPPLALLAILAAAACFAESGVMVKRHPPGDPIAANALGMLIGAGLLLGLSVATGEPLAVPSRTETWLALAYLVVFGSVVVFVLVLYVLERWSASATSYTFLLTPLVTIVLGAMVLGEQVRPTFVIGGVLVLAGVYVGAFHRPRGRVAGAEPSPATGGQPASTAEPATVAVSAQNPCP
jgi:drug/metabolite transporter (DMT)-like permease